MSRPYDPNDDLDMNDFDIDGFNIEDYTRQVDFGDGASAPQGDAAGGGPDGGSFGDTGEYTPVAYREREHPQRKHTRKDVPTSVRVLRRILIVLIYLLVITVVGYLLATFGWRWGNDLLALDKDELTTTVTLTDEMFTEEEVTDEEGNTETVLTADMDQVSELLQESGLIEYKWLFSLFAVFSNKDTSLSPGTYELNTDMDYSALLRNMTSSSTTRTTVEVTIPEGYTVEDIIELLAEQNVASEEDLLDAAANYEFDYDFLDGSALGDITRLEGYLFPDTYEFYENGDAATALARMLANFQSKIEDEEIAALLAEAEAEGYSLSDIITVASIIEKETDGVDQTSIASVIYNRLNSNEGGTNGYLQMDSTIYYILGDGNSALTSEDLAIDSPYNTYLYQGLPAGPICCPGLTAIQAALEPDETDYYYFILGDDGSTYFFSDYNEFLAFRDAQTGGTTGEDDDAEG